MKRASLLTSDSHLYSEAILTLTIRLVLTNEEKIPSLNSKLKAPKTLEPHTENLKSQTSSSSSQRFESS